MHHHDSSFGKINDITFWNFIKHFSQCLLLYVLMAVDKVKINTLHHKHYNLSVFNNLPLFIKSSVSTCAPATCSIRIYISIPPNMRPTRRSFSLVQMNFSWKAIDFTMLSKYLYATYIVADIVFKTMRKLQNKFFNNKYFTTCVMIKTLSFVHINMFIDRKIVSMAKPPTLFLYINLGNW